MTFIPPTLDELKLHGDKIGLPDSQCELMFYFYGSKDWFVGRTKMKNWHMAASGWKLRWQQQGDGGHGSHGGNRPYSPSGPPRRTLVEQELEAINRQVNKNK